MPRPLLSLLQTGLLTIQLATLFTFAAADQNALAQTNVLTQHNDMGRTGQNTTETILTPTSITAGNFGKLFSLFVDGQIYAQPLIMSGLTINGSQHNVAFVVTEHDSVYAFDSDGPHPALWQASLLDVAHGAAPGATTDPESDTGCGNIGTEYGITGTPVIDPAGQTLYVVAKTFENGYPVQRLHALNILTGAEKFNGPTIISATVRGTGNGTSGGVINFDPKWANQRSGLLLVNGVVYIAFGSHCDFGPWHGWVMAYNATTLQQTAAFLTTPNGFGGGVWMAGSGLAADTLGPNGAARIYLATGNGTFDATQPYATNTADYGDAVLRLDTTNGLTVGDLFASYDQVTLATTDGDQGSGGILLLPDQPGPNPHLAIQVGKSARLFELNRDNLGGYNSATNNVVQELDGQVAPLLGLPAYWNNNIFIWPQYDILKQFSLTNGLLSPNPISTAAHINGIQGITPSISSNGTQTPIVWAYDWGYSILYAYDGTNLNNILWTSNGNLARDSFLSTLQFTAPTIANGKVYMGNINQLNVYGLIPAPDFSLTATATSLTATQGTTVTDSITVNQLNNFSGTVALTASNLPAAVNATFTATATSVTASFAVAPTATPGSYSITLTGTSGVLSHTLTISLQVLAAPVVTRVTLPYNVFGIFTNGAPVTNRGLDNNGYAYSAQQLGTSVTSLGVTFALANPGIANAVTNSTINLSGSFSSIQFLATAVNGAQLSQRFVVTYTDGSTTTFTQSLSDWCLSQANSGETVASAMTYRLASTGKPDSSCKPNLYAYSLRLNNAKTLKNIKLPGNRNVVIPAIYLVP